jgi:rhodanese-related sulfurtransferase
MMRAAFALAALLALAPGVVSQPEDEAPRISQTEFKKLVAAKKVIIVDTRNPDAFAAGHIPGAILLPLEGQLTWSDEYQKTVVEPLKRAKKPIVTYCA